MRPSVRRARIAELVRRQSEVTVDALADRFRASRETIRRDLTALADAGLVQKIHGGAKSPPLPDREGPFADRMLQNAAAKREIAVKAAALVAPGQTLFIDTGSTTLIAAEELARVSSLTVITNSTRIAETIASAGGRSSVFLLGGRFEADNRETVGPGTISEIATFHADMALITVGAVDLDAGLMDYSFDEAQVARSMIDHSDRSTVLADASKFGRRAAFRVGPLGRADHLVTDRALSPEWTEALKGANVELH